MKFLPLLLFGMLIAESYSPTGYVVSLDDVEVPCPLVELRGKLLRHTFAGVPNYESIEDGDALEKRWVLEILPSEIDQLRQNGYIPQEEIFISEEKGWVQVISPTTESYPYKFLNKQVVVVGYLGTLVFHVHTPVAIEATGIYDDE